MALLKKIFYVLFFFQLTTAAAYANADIILSNPIKQSSQGRDVSSPFHNPVKTIQQDEVDDDSPESNEGKSGRSKTYVRFLHNRTNYSAALLPARQLIPGFVPAFVKQEPTRNVVRDACLPAYYDFLFRLSPF
jgi:hypothetical protein